MTTVQHDIKRHPTVTVNINDLTFDEQNPNVMSQQEEAGLRKSFHTFGDVSPIVIDQNNFIVHGNHRAAVLKELGATEINAVRKEFSSDVERIECAQTLNKLHGEYDKQLDSAQLLQVLNAGRLDSLAELIAKGREELENTLTKYQGIHFQHEDDFNVEKALEDLVPETQLGDIWQLGEHRIICADCSDERSIKRLMLEEKADMVLADPPYNIANNISTHLYAGTTAQKIDELEHTEWDKNFDIGPCLDMIAKVLAQDVTVYIFTSQYVAGQIWDWMKGWAKYYNYLVYCKTDPMPTLMKRYWTWCTELICAATRGKHVFNYINGQHNPNYLVFSRQDDFKGPHITQKPIRLLSEIIKHSSNENQIILDPFIGTGSTLVACEQTGRICYGCDISPHYIEVAVKRWEAYTHRKATKLGGGSQ